MKICRKIFTYCCVPKRHGGLPKTKTGKSEKFLLLRNNNSDPITSHHITSPKTQNFFFCKIIPPITLLHVRYKILLLRNNLTDPIPLRPEKVCVMCLKTLNIPVKYYCHILLLNTTAKYCITLPPKIFCLKTSTRPTNTSQFPADPAAG